MVFAVNSPDTKVDTIDITYLESGHSYMECDSMHSRIEKTKKGRRIYTPTEMRMVIEQARSKPTRYNVYAMNFNEFYDFKKLYSEMIANSTFTADGKKVQYLKVKWFRFVRGSSEVLFKYDYNEEFKVIPFEKDPLLINPPKRKRVSKLPQPSTSTQTLKNLPAAPPKVIQNVPVSVARAGVTLSQLFFSRLQISVAKKRDLMKLLKDGVIPPVYGPDFYNGLEAGKDIKDTFPYMFMAEEEVDDPEA